MKLIPLRNRAGDVRAWAMVDAEDYGRLSAYRWKLTNHGYAARNARRDVGEGVVWVTVFMHREVLGLTHGDERRSDHINGDRLDNRRCNLRAVTNAENCQNRGPRANRGSTSRFRGVSWKSDRGKWAAQVQVDGRNRVVGYFDDEIEAAEAARLARAEAYTHHGEEAA